MVQQARTYLAGAVSATVVVAIAVVAFVVLVSLQALQDWPLARLGGADEESATISNARPAPAASGSAAGGGGAATAAAPAGADDVRVAPSPPGSVDATAPQATQAPDGGPGPAAGDRPAGSSPGGSTSSGNGPATAPPAAEETGVSKTLEDTVKGTVAGVEQTVEETVAGAGETVQGLTGQATGPSSPVGQLTEQVSGVAGGLLGGGR